MKCPHKGHPDWIALVAKIGVDRAYLEYLRNGEEIPNPDNYTEDQYSIAANPIDDDSLLLPGFDSFFQQQEAVNTLASSVLAFYKENYKTKIVHFNDAINNFKNELNGVIEENPDNTSFKVIRDSLPELKELVRDKIYNLGLVTNKKEDIEDVDIEGLDAADIDNTYKEDDWVFKRDAKTNALKEIKQFLAFVPRTEYNKTNKEYIQIDSYLSTPEIRVPSYMSYDQTFEELRAILSDIDPTWEAMTKELQKFEISKPWINTVLKLIEEEDDVPRLKNQFITTMSSSYSNAKTILWKEINGKYYLQTIDTDQTSVEKTIKAIWSAGYRISNLIKNDENNNQVSNKETIKEVLAQIDEVQKNPTAKAVGKLLDTIGINVSNKTLEVLIGGEFNRLKISSQFTNANGLFLLIKKRLEGKQNVIGEEVLDQVEDTNANNPIINNSAVDALARLEATNSNYAYSNSYKNGEGSTVYSYTYNKALTKKFRRLVNDPNFVNKLLNITFTKPITVNNKVIYKSWLHQLAATTEEFKKIFSISPLDTIRQARQGAQGLKLTSMSDLDIETTKLALIQNSGRSNNAVGRIIKHLITVPSKTTSYVVQASGIDIKPFFREDGQYILDTDTVNALYSIAASEHNRVISQEARNNDNKAYNTGSKYFYFFPSLNKDKSPEIYTIKGNIKLPTDILENGITVEQYIRDKIINIIRQNIEKKIQSWTTLGVIEDNKLKIVDTNYLEKIVIPRVKNEKNKITYAAIDYVINSTLAEFNMHQMFIGDPALYYKTNIKTTWDNIDKRLSALLAPGYDLALTSLDEKFISVKLIDREKGNNALNYAQLSHRLANYYEKQGIKNPYEEIDGTDAQEYTTLREDLYVKYASGKIPTKTYNSILSKLGDDNLVLNETELNLILGATKPVYSDTIIYDNQDYTAEEYVKSSSIPLLPQFTKGLEIDKLRRAMEAYEKKTNLPVRAVFNSGTKVGGLKSVNIWNPDGSIVDNLDLTDYGVVLNRSGFSIQQDIPYDPKKAEVVKATQPTKQLFDAVLEIDGFRYQGKGYTGEELKEVYNDLHKELYSTGLKALNTRILTNDLLDIPKLKKVITEEAASRGYTPAQISFLKLNEDNNNFETPFWSNPSASRLESLVTSLYSNNILKQKLHGRSFVLVSEEAIGKNISQGITYTKNYDPSIGLQPFRIIYRKEFNTLEEEEYNKLSKEEKEGYKEIVKPAQVILPWTFKEKSGAKINIKNFIDDKNQIDLTKIPKDLLTQFGFRIPCQGHNSMSLIEIVGFFPEGTQDIIVAPRNFVPQMGSDFDVDKLFVYDYYLENKDGILHKIDNVKNKIVDIHKSVLYNPKVFNSVVKPLDLGKLKYKTTSNQDKGIAVELKNLSNTDYYNYLNPDYSKYKYLQSVDGKAMVGIESLSNTFSALIQGHNLYLQKVVKVDKKKEYLQDFIYFGTDDGKVLKLSDLSSPYTYTGRKKNEVDAAYQSAAVDNEKDPILDFINSNPITASVQNLLRKLGMEEELSLFLAQPAIKEYVNLVRGSRGSLVIQRGTADQFLDQTVEKYLNLLTPEDRLLSESLGVDYPLTPKELRQVLYGETGKLSNDLIEYLTLIKYQKLKVFGDIINTTQANINVESRGIGKSLIEVADKAEVISRIPNIESITNLSRVLGDYTESELEPKTLSGYAIKSGLLSANDTINDGQLLPYALGNVQYIFNEFENVAGYQATTEQKEDTWKAIKSYVYSKHYTQERREQLMFDRGNYKSLNSRIRSLRNNKLKNNDFILRLDISQVDISGKKPSYVFYNSAKEENIEELNVYQALIDLVNSKDSEISSIGNDLINYFFINGGDQQAREWGKYINSSMVRHIGLNELLKRVNFNDPNILGISEDSNISSFSLQYFQHNPYQLTQIKKTSLTNLAFKGNAAADALELNLPSPIEGKLREINKTGIGYLPMFSIAGSKAYNGVGIFLFNKKNSDGTFNYIRIPNLGTKFYSEYQDAKPNEIKPSLLNKKFIVNNRSIHYTEQGQEVLASPTEEIINPIISAEIKSLVDTDLVTSLSNIDSHPYHTALANLFLKLENLLKDIPVKLDTSVKFAEGRYKNRGIFVNPDTLPTKKYAYENTILKEAVHALIDSIKNNGFTPTAKQKEALASLEYLYFNIREQVLNGELESLGWFAKELKEFDRISTKAKKRQLLTQKETNWLLDNSTKYYGISAKVDENGEVTEDGSEDFIHEALLQPKFMERLNEIKYSKGKSIFKRFGDLINTIVDEFRKILGINPNSALEEAVANLVKLVEHPIKNTNITKQVRGEEFAFASKTTQDKTDTNYTRIVNDFKSRIHSIDTSITTARLEDNKELATRLITRKERVREEMNALVEDNTFGGIISQANIDLKYVKDILYQDKISTQDIRYSEKVLATWSKIANPLYGVVNENDIKGDTKRYEEAQEVVKDADKLSRRLSTVQVGTLFDLIKKAAPNLEITQEDLLVVKDISAAQSNFRDISTSDSIVASVTAKWIKDANFLATTDANEMLSSLEDILKELHNNSTFKSQGYQKTFGQQDEDGNYTGELADSLKAEYHNTINRLLNNASEAPNENFKAKARKKYYDWIKENHIIVDIRKIAKQDSDGKYLYEENETYLNALKNSLGEAFERTLKRAKDNIDKYNEELQLQIDSHAGDPDGFRILEKWKAQNDPAVYMNNLVNGYQKQVIEGKVVYNKGHKYVTHRALASWEDEKYNSIQKDEALKKFYDYFTTTINQLRKYLPHSYQEEFSSTDIPNINKDLIEQLRDSKVGEGLGLVWSKLLENISVTDNSADTGLIDSVTGGLDKNFKIAYLKSINPNDKSYDLGKVLKVFALEVLEYKHKSLVEDKVRLAESILNKALEKKLTAIGDTVTDKFGAATTVKGLRNLYNQFDYALEAFYGNKRDTKEGATSKALITPKNKKLLDEEIDKINKSKKSDEAKVQAINDVTKKYTRYYSFSRIGDTILQYVQIKGMGWNVFGSLNNLLFGYVANNNWASGERDFTNKELTRATGIMLSFSKDMEAKVASFMQGYNTVKELNEVAFRSTTNNNKARRGIEKLSPYELYRKGEYFVQGQTMVSMLLHKKIKVKEKATGEEKELSVWDAYRKFGTIDEKYEEITEWSIRGAATLAFKNNLDQIIKTIHGNYDPNSPVLMKKKVLGRALLQFRSWIAEGVATRFDDEKYDLLLQRSTKGRFRTLADLGLSGSLRTIVKQIIYRNSDEAFAELDKLGLTQDQLEVAKENMKKNLNELYQKTALVTMYLILSNLALDDDDWELRIARNYTVNSLLRLSDDIEFYFSPTAFENITRSAIPATTLIVDGTNLLDAIGKSIIGDDEYKSGIHAHESRTLYRALKVLPFGSAIEANINKAKSQETFRK